VYQITFSASIMREKSATRHCLIGLGINGTIPNMFIVVAPTQLGNRQVVVSSTIITQLKASDTVSLWLRHFSSDGVRVEEIEIINTRIVANQIQ